MKIKFPFELRFFTAIMFIAAIVAAIGTLTFGSMKNIITTVSDEGTTPRRQLLVREILNTLSDAENSVKTFSITHDTDYLSPFYLSAALIDEKMDTLYSLPADTVLQRILADSMNTLVEKKFGILNEILALQNDDRVKDALTRISVKLDKSPKPIAADTLVTAEPVKKQKSNIFRNIFGKKEQPIAQTEPSKPVKPKPVLQVDDMKREISIISKEESKLRTITKQKELELTRKDKEVMDQVRSLVASLNALDAVAVKKRTKKIEQLASETNSIIAQFCIAAALLLLVMAFVIVSYTRKNRAYGMALKEAKLQAEAHALAKERFLANMSHEIRTPMNAIAGFTEQVLQSELSSEQQEQLLIVKRSADHLLGLLNSILDFSKLEAGKLILEKIPFDPAAIAKEVVQMLQPQARSKNITLSCLLQDDLPPFLLGDPVRFRQILLNLTANAVKFTEKGSVSCSFSFRSISEKEIFMQIAIADTGIGIPKNELEKIFDEFEQADKSTTRKFGGTGLGLTITKKLVELHNGEIIVDSEVNKGTTITVKMPFPLSAAPAVEKKKSIVVPGALKNKKVLITDDKEYNRKLLKMIFDKWGVLYHEAGNGEEALAFLKTNKVDLVFMDVRMPVMDGLQATRKIKELYPGLPVIALTAASSGEDLLECKTAGMDHFLSKPFREAELLEVFTLALGTGKNGESSFVKKNGVNVDHPVTINEKLYSLDELKRLANGDQKFMRDMLSLFLTTTREGIEDIRTSISKKDWPAVREHAHKISAPCKHIDAMQCWELLKQLEEQAKNGDGKAVTGSFSRLDKVVSELTNALEKELA